MEKSIIGSDGVLYGLRELSRKISRPHATVYRQLKKGFIECDGITYSMNEKPVKNDLWEKLRSNYSQQELEAIAKGRGLGNTQQISTPVVTAKIGRHKLLCISDTHIGSKYTNYNDIKRAIKIAEEQQCEAIIHTGDVVEGTARREGMVFECTEYSFGAQREKAIELFSETKLPIYCVNGNHDLWTMQKVGVNMCEDLDRMIPNFHYLGNHTGEVMIGSIKVGLFHGEDGNSYATSYRVQKVVESLQGGTKPGIMFFGHTHKYCVLFERNIHCISLGSLQMQTTWERAKRIAVHCGFSICEFEEANGEVISLQNRFYPIYK